MSLLSWSMSALTVCVMAWTAAQPSPRATAPTTPPSVAQDALLARVEREVTPTLRARHEDRWRYSRVHRPTPTLRAVSDPGRSTPRHASFRILPTPWPGQAEVEAHLVRVERATGRIEIASGALAAGVQPAFVPFVADPVRDPRLGLVEESAPERIDLREASR